MNPDARGPLLEARGLSRPRDGDGGWLVRDVRVAVGPGDRLGGELSGWRAAVKGLLALGATRWEAARGPVQQPVRTGMIPIINAMMVVGIVSLPGMRTGGPSNREGRG